MRSEEALVDRIDSGELRDVGQIERHLDDVAHVESGGRQDLARVVERLIHLRFEAVDDFAGRGVEADLAGGERKTAGDDRLRIWADGVRGVCGGNRAKGHVRGSFQQSSGVYVAAERTATFGRGPAKP